MTNDRVTLRDYFAGQAIVGCLDESPPGAPSEAGRAMWFQWVATAAYDLADAMLEARSRSPAPVDDDA